MRPTTKHVGSESESFTELGLFFLTTAFCFAGVWISLAYRRDISIARRSTDEPTPITVEHLSMLGSSATGYLTLTDFRVASSWVQENLRNPKTGLPVWLYAHLVPVTGEPSGTVVIFVKRGPKSEADVPVGTGTGYVLPDTMSTYRRVRDKYLPDFRGPLVIVSTEVAPWRVCVQMVLLGLGLQAGGLLLFIVQLVRLTRAVRRDPLSLERPGWMIHSINYIPYNGYGILTVLVVGFLAWGPVYLFDGSAAGYFAVVCFLATVASAGIDTLIPTPLIDRSAAHASPELPTRLNLVIFVVPLAFYTTIGVVLSLACMFFEDRRGGLNIVSMYASCWVASLGGAAVMLVGRRFRRKRGGCHPAERMLGLAVLGE